MANQLQFGDVQLYNPWVGFDCVDLQSFTFVYGTILSFGPQFGQHDSSSNGTDITTPQVQDPYTYDKIPPPKGAKVSKGTIERCGGWHVVDKADSCARICAVAEIHIDLLLEVNTDLGDAQKCSDNLAVGNAYFQHISLHMIMGGLPRRPNSFCTEGGRGIGFASYNNLL
ncbi:hypothetical protein QYS62_006712 [Fusarium acuminatum]|uniref:LysM domain-containing protein n=1 Tax=Fusarium acuminatum TaxID=5515 RepID=A0ABZ2X152_9HYPO